MITSSVLFGLKETVQAARDSMEHAQCWNTPAASRAKPYASRWRLCVDMWWVWISLVGIISIRSGSAFTLKALYVTYIPYLRYSDYSDSDTN